MLENKNLPIPDLEGIQREKAKRRLKEFVKQAWKIIEPATPFVENWHIDAMCLPYDSMVITNEGIKKIGEIVERGTATNVLSFHHESGEFEWRKIISRIKSIPKEQLYEIEFDGGNRLTLTANHPVFIENRGYIRASGVKVDDSCLQAMSKAVSTQSFANSRRIVQHAVFRGLQNHFRKNDLSQMRSYEKLGRKDLPFLLGENVAAWSYNPMSLLQFADLPHAGSLARKFSEIWRVLQPSMFWGVLQRIKQRGLYRRQKAESVSKIFQDNQETSFGSRLLSLLFLWIWQAYRGSSYRPQSRQQRNVESDDGVSFLSQSPSGAAICFAVSKSRVVAIEKKTSLPEMVYNIEVEGNNNYFAQGVLIHNCEHLQAVFNGEILNLLINVPPRHSKSSIAAVCWPAWGWIKKPSFDWLFSSYSGGRAIDDSVSCRRIIESAWYRRNWGHVFHLTSDQNQKSRFENSETGKRIAIGLLGAGTGEGGDVVAVDDAHNINDQYSPKKLKAAIDAWDQVFSQRANDPKHSRKVIIGQRMSARDLSSHVMKQGGYELLTLPTEYDPKRMILTGIGWKDPRTIHGELLNPERVGPKEVSEAKRRLGARGFAAQHQQNPSEDEGAIFKRPYWKYYREKPEEIGKAADTIVLSVDCAFKDEQSSSLVAIHAWAKKGPNKYLLDRDSTHKDFIATVRALVRMAEKWPDAIAKIIEDKANGPAVINICQEKLPGLIAYQPEGSKVSRANAMQPEHEAGNIWLPHSSVCDWVEEFVEYTAAFPEGEFDDDIDAMTQAWDWFRTHDNWSGETLMANNADIPERVRPPDLW